MKWVERVGSASALVMCGVGMVHLSEVAPAGSHLSIGVLGITAGPSLVFGLYAAQLARRVRILEAAATANES